DTILWAISDEAARLVYDTRQVSYPVDVSSAPHYDEPPFDIVGFAPLTFAGLHDHEPFEYVIRHMSYELVKGEKVFRRLKGSQVFRISEVEAGARSYFFANVNPEDDDPVIAIMLRLRDGSAQA